MKSLEFEKNTLRSLKKLFLSFRCFLLKYSGAHFIKVFKKLIKVFLLLLLFCSQGRIKVKIIWENIFWLKIVKVLVMIPYFMLKIGIFGLEKPWKALNSINFCLYEPRLIKYHFVACYYIIITYHLSYRPELNILALQPWKNMQIPSKVDAALEEVGLNL